MIQVATRITEEEKQALEIYCKQQDISLAKMLKRAINMYMTKETNRDDWIYSFQQEDSSRTNSSGV